MKECDSEATFRLMFANNPLPMWVYDLETLRFLEVNEAAVARYGYSRQEFLQMRISDIRPPEDLSRLFEKLAADRPDLQFSGSWRHQLKSGELIEVEIISHTLAFAGRESALVVAIDITERKQAETALRQSEAINRAVLTAIPDMIFRVRRDGTIEDYIPAQEFEPLLPPAEFLGKKITEVMPLEHSQQSMRRVELALQTGMTQVFEYELMMEGERHAYEARYTASGAEEVLVIVRDVTAQKRTEVAQQQYAERLEVLYELNRAITSSLRLADVYNTFAYHAARLLPFDRMSITLLDGEVIRVVYVAGEAADQTALPVGTSLSRQASAVGWVVAQGQPWVRNEIRADTGLEGDEPLVAEGIRSAMVVPLRVKNQTMGTWNLGSQAVSAYGPDELEIAQSMANQLATAVENARLYKQARQEIEERHQAEAAARQSEKRFRQVIDSISDHIYVTEITAEGDHLNRYLSPNVEALTGYAPERFLADWRFWPEKVIHPDDRAAAVAQLERLKRGQDSELEYRLIRADERVIWVRDSARVEKEGRSHVIFGVVSDITARKETEAELALYREQLESLVRARTSELERAMAEIAEARDRIDAILRSVADGLIVTDLEHKVILANPAAESLLGFQLAAVAGREFEASLIDPRLPEIVRQTLTQQVGLELEFEQEDPAEERSRILRARTALVDDQRGQPLGTVTLIQDVTRLREVDRLKTQFMTTAAHELRTPLTSILGFSEILLTRQLKPQRQQHYLRLINDQSSQLSRLIEELLDISRLESGRGPEFKLTRIDLAQLMEEVVLPFAETATRHTIRVEGLTELPTIKGDPFRLAQVGRNLLSNAIKYSPAGGVITIRGQVTGEYVELSVEDEGLGMTPEQQEHLFEPFYRADASNTAIGGTGLGLVITRLIVEQHRGQIWLESQRDQGTTIYFTLPLAEAQECESSKGSRSLDHAGANLVRSDDHD